MYLLFLLSLKLFEIKHHIITVLTDWTIQGWRCVWPYNMHTFPGRISEVGIIGGDGNAETLKPTTKILHQKKYKYRISHGLWLYKNHIQPQTMGDSFFLSRYNAIFILT